MACEQLIRIGGIVDDSITDGPGLRMTLFTQGCPHHCPGCHNPETWDPVGGTLCSAAELFARVQRNPLLSGVTLSGGEPFFQAVQLLPFARMVRDASLELAAYTGYTIEELLTDGDAAQRELLALCDVLVDGRFVLEQKSLALRFRGSHNQRVLDVQASLAQQQAVWMQQERWVGSACAGTGNHR